MELKRISDEIIAKLELPSEGEIDDFIANPENNLGDNPLHIKKVAAMGILMDFKTAQAQLEADLEAGQLEVKKLETKIKELKKQIEDLIDFSNGQIELEHDQIAEINKFQEQIKGMVEISPEEAKLLLWAITSSLGNVKKTRLKNDLKSLEAKLRKVADRK